MNTKQYNRFGESGQDLIEYALLLPLLLLLILGIINFAIVIFSYNTIGNAAREGARAGIIHDTSSAEIETAASQLTTGLNGVQISTQGAPCTTAGEAITVTVNYSPTLIGAEVVMGKATLPLRAVSSMKCE